MSSVIIRDEGERRALEAALWHAMRPILDPNDMSPIGEAIFDAAEAVTRRRDAVDLSALAAEVDEAIGAVLALRASIDRLRTSDLGDAIEAGVSEESLVTHLQTVQERIEEYAGSAHLDGGFWNQDPTVREQLVSARDGAVRLLAGLRSEVAA